MPGSDNCRLELVRDDTLDAVEHSGHSIEVSSQLFFSPSGWWSEGLLWWNVKKSRRGFFFSPILDLCWGLVFWCTWFLLVLGKLFLQFYD